jgi:predicted nuclease with TOPRIM domain
MAVTLNEDDDFGFSLVSEEELKAKEAELQAKLLEQSQVVQEVVKQASQTEASVTEYKDKLNGLRNMVMPLLNNLAKDPSKTYVFWPDRATKIKAFIMKVNAYVDGA